MSDTMAQLPIFPLQAVLFPGGTLPLRVFEARYVDMLAQCYRNDTEFGVNLVVEGAEVSHLAVPHAVGVSARITAWDDSETGVLQVVTQGQQRFLIKDVELDAERRLLAHVVWIDEPLEQAVPEGFDKLVDLLAAIIADAGDKHFPLPHRMDEAGWVGMRLAAVLPVPMLARQRLLELDDPVSRLEIIRTYLEQHGLIKG